MSPREDIVPEVKSVDSAAATAPVHNDVASEVKVAAASRLLRPRRDHGIQVIGHYFLGQMDRNMFNGHYGRGYFIYVDGVFSGIREYNPATYIITLESGVKLLLDDEPSFELFMAVMGVPWDETYRAGWMGDDDRADYVPYVYRMRADFVSRTGEFYHPYTARQ